MSVADIGTARNTILARFKAIWAASAHASVPVIYDDTTENPPAGGSPYVVVKVQHNVGAAASISNGNNTRFRAFGQVMVMLFPPINDGLTLGDAYVKVTQNAFEGKTLTGDIVFRNVSVREVGGKGTRYQVNVIAQFEYDRLVSRS